LSPQGQNLQACGWKVIGIQWDIITNGTKAIGLDRRTRELGGLRRAMTANVIMRATGMETTAALNTITTRITIETAITTVMTNTKLAITAGTTDK
jgi:hypothetical protein